jgi:TolB protein
MNKIKLTPNRLFVVAFLLCGLMTIQTPAAPTILANGKIAFTSDRDGNQEIYVMNNDGTGQVRLTNNYGADNFPAFSPDGTKIAFVSQNPSPTFAINIRLMNADGTNQTELTPIAIGGSQSPWADSGSLSWSPDGSKIAFGDGGEIFTINVDASNRTNLTNHPANDFDPAWSPNGALIAFASDRRDPNLLSIIYSMNVDGSNIKVLSDSGYYASRFSPDWSPNGNELALIQDEFSEFGAGSILLTNFPGYFVDSSDAFKPKWSPDGTKIVFHSCSYDTSANCQIYFKNVNGSGLTQLTNTNGRNFQPSWQPLMAVKSRKRIRFF